MSQSPKFSGVKAGRRCRRLRETLNFLKNQEPEYLPVPPHSSRRVCGRPEKTSSRKRRMRAVDEAGGSRASLPLEKLEVTCYAESFMAHGRCFSFGSAVYLPRTGCGIVGASEAGSGNRGNRR